MIKKVEQKVNSPFKIIWSNVIFLSFWFFSFYILESELFIGINTIEHLKYFSVVVCIYVTTVKGYYMSTFFIFWLHFSSYDERISGRAVHWKDMDVLGHRAKFLPRQNLLHLSEILVTDAVTYICRVDYRSNPTLTYYINLTVIGKLLSMFCAVHHYFFYM